MSEKRTHADYLQKAAMYDLLAQFYKYSNPGLHMHFYLKHYKNMNKAMDMMRTHSQTYQEEAKIRVLHTSHDASNVDIYINGKRMIRDLPFKNVSTDIPLRAGKYHIDIYPAGNMVDSVLNKKITMEPGKSYTLATIDHVKKMRLLMFENLPQVPANEAKVRFIHLSPDTQPLDIAVKDRDIVFPNLTYKQATEYLALTPMTVDLEVREAGSETIILPIPQLQFRANESCTIVFVGLTKDKPEFQIISIKD
ncbi:DUF4397 domain-containing protein [Neobacillus vireti]|uniref:DUF4397 domain-containing protein n=1 Tax=Neobacillus vireti LMG 21834 TaxID=1131730 RepID=A0AB94IMX2_9BACI|nr:DUF4397 domain-containing protein [Neobacillus vireti]ETI68425.1 hypothetical protein BAVI_12474 [Neobacillus vireti LMG 21834]KLT17271.1 hypothetical protein AA980_15440 [Neobacillus vireti]